MQQVGQELGIKARAEFRVDKFDAAGNFVDAVTEVREIVLTPAELEIIQRQHTAAADPTILALGQQALRRLSTL